MAKCYEQAAIEFVVDTVREAISAYLKGDSYRIKSLSDFIKNFAPTGNSDDDVFYLINNMPDKIWLDIALPDLNGKERGTSVISKRGEEIFVENIRCGSGLYLGSSKSCTKKHYTKKKK